MNFLTLLPLALLIIPIIPALMEIFRRKDKGPRKFPEETTLKEKQEISKHLLDLEHLRAAARIKGTTDVIRIVGDLSIPDGAEIKESIVTHGSLKIGKRCHLYGSIKSSGEVEVGDETVVEGHILSEGKVTIGPRADIRGIVDSSQDIILKEGATVEAVSTEKSIRMDPGAKIRREIRTGVSTSISLQDIQKSQPETITLEKIGGLPESEKPPQSSSVFKEFFQARKTPELGSAGKTVETGLTEVEANVLKLVSMGRDVYEIGLALLLDPVQVQSIMRGLIEKNYLTRDLKTVFRKEDKIEKTRQEAPRMEEEGRIEEVFENLLASKMRDEVKKKIQSMNSLSEKGSSMPISERKQGASNANTDVDIVNSSEKSLHDVEIALKEWRKASSLIFEEKEEPSKKTGKGNPYLQNE